MAKESFYFRHDYNARNDDKVLELRAKYGAEGYGIFWMIIESMAENEDGGLNATYLGGLSIGFGISKEKLVNVIEFLISINLIYKENNKYFSKRLLDHKQFRKFLSEKGKEGVRIREENKQRFKGGLSNTSSKERKGKERKEVNKEAGVKNLKIKLHGMEEVEVFVLVNCEEWQLNEMVGFVKYSQQNFEAIAMNNPLMNVRENFTVVVQEFINMIQSTNDYKEANELRRFFGNWVSKKNGSLAKFIQDCKSKETLVPKRKSKNEYI